MNTKERKKQYYIDNKEKIREQQKQYHDRIRNKEKISTRDKQWYINNREKILKHDKQYYINNKEKKLGRMKLYQINNKEKIAKQRKQHYIENQEALKEVAKQYRLNNQEKIKRCRVNSKERRAEWQKQYLKTEAGKAKNQRGYHKRRAMEEGTINTLTSKEWIDILKNYKFRCAYCGCEFTLFNRETRDHVIPISKGGNNTKENIVPACRSCNSKKNNKSIKIKESIKKVDK